MKKEIKDFIYVAFDEEGKKIVVESDVDISAKSDEDRFGIKPEDFVCYIRKDLSDKEISDLYNKLGNANNEIDRLSMRLYTKS